MYFVAERYKLLLHWKIVISLNWNWISMRPLSLSVLYVVEDLHSLAVLKLVCNVA